MFKKKYSKLLGELTEILNSQNFNEIANEKRIVFIINEASNIIHAPNRTIETYISILEVYLQYLKRFYDEKSCWKDKDLTNAYKHIVYGLSDIINISKKLLEIEPEKRKFYLPLKNYKKRIKRDKKEFQMGLKIIYNVIENIFSMKRKIKVMFNREEYIRYIFNKKRGLGKKYKFEESKDKYAFIKHINDLSLKEIEKVVELLKKETDVRKEKSWLIYGSKDCPIRIMVRPNLTKEVVYLFRNVDREKDIYNHYVFQKS